MGPEQYGQFQRPGDLAAEKKFMTSFNVDPPSTLGSLYPLLFAFGCRSPTGYSLRESREILAGPRIRSSTIQNVIRRREEGLMRFRTESDWRPGACGRQKSIL